MPPPPRASGLGGRTVALVLVLVALLVVMAGATTYRAYARDVRASVGAQLETVAELKATELAQWRAERAADARFFSENRTFAGLAGQIVASGDPAAIAEVLAWFDRMRAGDRYARLALLDASGAVRLALPEASPADEAALVDVAAQSHASGRVEWLDFHRHASGTMHLSLLAPITADDGTPLASVALHVDPESYLSPFLQRWPLPSDTAVSLLARRDGDALAYLHPLRRGRADAALDPRVPLTRTEIPSVRGALGATGLLEGVDERGQPVVAAVREVPDSPWILVARIDPDEAWAPIVARLWQTIAIGLLCFVAAGSGLAGAWQRSRAQTDEALRASEHRYRQLFDASPQPMWVEDTETGRFVAVNEAAVTRYGWPRDVFLRLSTADLRPPDDATPALADGAGLARHRIANGTVLDVELATHEVEMDGRSARLVLAHDVTARLRAEQRVKALNDALLRESLAGSQALARLHALMEASPTILYTRAPDLPSSPATWVSDNITRILGYSVIEALEAGWWEAGVHPDDRARAQAASAVLPEVGEIVHEYRFRDRGGRYRTIRDELRLTTRPSSTIPEAVGAWTDITAQREAEARQRVQLSVMEATANAIVVTSVDGVIEWANPAFALLTGYALEEAIGRRPGELLRSDRHDAAFYREMWETVLDGRVWRGDLVNRRKDGTLYDEEMTITPVRDAAGAIAHFVAIKQDISERRHLQEQLLQAQRMESVGRLAGGVAHDFNNLLTVINSYAELALGDLDDGHPLRPLLDEIHQAGTRAAALTRQLLAFSRKQVLHPRDLDLNQVVAAMESMLRRLIGEDIALAVAPDPRPCVVRADPGQIEQVLMNLAVNARDAMPTGGTLTIDTRYLEVTPGRNAQDPRLRPGTWVVMTVADTGHGMPEEVRARIFEPFFTTKAPGQGTGLGLPTVFGIVEQSGGTIWVDTAPDAGTRFTVCLPASGQQLSPPAATTIPDTPTGTETILIVEDDPMVRNLTRQVLSASGYRVLAASSGDEALAVLDHRDTPVDLLLTDVVMPGMTGRELAERVRQQWPATKILFMSGYTDDAIVRHGVLDGQARLLNKPFTRAQILTLIREVLDGA